MRNEEMMTERQKMMDEVDRATKKMTDLRDMLRDGVPEAKRRVILRQLNVLSDIIFYNQDSIKDT